VTRKIANAFLLLFLLDGALTLLLSLSGSSSPALRAVQGFAALLTLLFGLAVYGLLALSPRLPKRAFLPCLLFLGWALLGAMPIPLQTETDQGMLYLSLAQIVLGVLAATGSWRRGGGFLLPEGSVTGPRFSPKYCVVFLLVHLLLLPPLLFGYGAYSAAVGVEHLSRGFIRLQWRGLEVQERVYVKGEDRIRLLPMVHIGDEAFYNGIVADLRRMEGVVLLEGVTDREKLITQPFSYGKTAGALGVSEQPRSLVGAGEDLTEGEGGEARLIAQRADLDMSDFSPETVALINRIGKLLAADDMVKALPEYLRTPVQPEPIIYDVLTLRNEALLASMDEALMETKHVIIPWGAAHMPGIEEALLARGFTLSDRRQRAVFRW
jgi:hypothetical protein